MEVFVEFLIMFVRGHRVTGITFEKLQDAIQKH